MNLDTDFAKVIKRGDYKVFLTPEGDCRGLYVGRKAASFEVRESGGGKSSVTFSYRIVGRRRDITRHRRFAKIDTRLPIPPTPTPRRKPTEAALRTFITRLEKEAREREPKRTRTGTKRRASAPRIEVRDALAVRREAQERRWKGARKGRR